jgi:mRNA-degrading endonuclease RelE of RelBE toxin-antitoxin system
VLEGLSEPDARGQLEDRADACAVRQALAEPGKAIPWKHVGAKSGAAASAAYRIEWRSHARKAFLILGKPARRRIGEAVDAPAADLRPVTANTIAGAHGVLRIRVGDSMVLYTIDEGELIVLAFEGGLRGEITPGN